MVASEDHERSWETQADVDACLGETSVTRDQVNRWRREGLLPKDVEQMRPEPYHGSETRYPAGTCAQIKAAQALFQKKEPRCVCRLAAMALWLSCKRKLLAPAAQANWSLGRPGLSSYQTIGFAV